MTYSMPIPERKAIEALADEAKDAQECNARLDGYGDQVRCDREKDHRGRHMYADRVSWPAA